MSEQDQVRLIEQDEEIQELRDRLFELSAVIAQNASRSVENDRIRIDANRMSEHIDLAIDEFHFSAPLSAMTDPDVRDAFAKGRNLLELKIIQLKRKESIHDEVS